MTQPSAHRKQSLAILVVDDNVQWRQLLKRILQADLGISPILAASGSGALRILKKQPIDVIISDLSMPVMSGNDLLKQVRLLYPRTKFIIISGDPSLTKMANELMASGA